MRRFNIRPRLHIIIMNKKIIHIISFGHRYGPLSPTPTLSYDIRDIPNPPREFRLQQKVSNDATALRRWLMNNEVFISRVEAVRRDVLDLIEKTNSEGRGLEGGVVIGVNCYLGRHRSVTFVEELGRQLKEDLGSSWEVRVRHRELERRS